jgi:Protein of unknown function (DUF2950)
MGGFGLVAWPAEYGVTGIHAFIVNHNGTVFEKDIEPDGGKTPAPVSRFDPDGSLQAARRVAHGGGSRPRQADIDGLRQHVQAVDRDT